MPWERGHSADVGKRGRERKIPADTPVSSVSYAIEAALRALRGDIALLLPTMGLVVAIIAVVIVNYHQLVGRYPQGGGAPAAAAASAIIAFLPNLAGLRAPIALLLVAGVAAGTWFGHRGRTVFAVMTVAFVVLTVVVLICGLFVTPGSQVRPRTSPQATTHPWRSHSHSR
jgi:hypothetical protein